MLNNVQIQRIYKLAAVLGMVNNNDDGNDELHMLVYNLTGCIHVSEMENSQYNTVMADLSAKARLLPPKGKGKKKGHYKTNPGGMSEGQQRKVWQLMDRLQGCDEKPCSSSLGERLCGIIKKELKIDAFPKEPFRWLKYEDGSRLIEIIKNYCRSTERKRMRGG